MEMDYNKPCCPILDVDGVISGGKQFDLDITLPDVNRKKYYNCFLIICRILNSAYYFILIFVKVIKIINHTLSIDF